MDLDMDKKINLLTRLKTLNLEMTESEKRIAEYILNNPEEIYNLKIEDLSNKLEMSLPTVFRFTTKLGFKGFKDFKVELIKDIAIGMNIEVEDIEAESIEATTKNIFEKISSNLKETLSLINYKDLSRAVDFIIKAKRIVFFAVSSSISVAFDSYSKFLRAGFNCFYDADAYTQRILSTQCTNKDVVIGISFSGESVEVVECLKNAKNNSANTICVTTFYKSPITDFSDICLYTAPVHSYYQKVDLPSKMSQTAILDSLYLNVVLSDRKRALNFISRSEEELIRFKTVFKGKI
jgi:DNA-binding MurR/RpiR family transcriptional regulator